MKLTDEALEKLLEVKESWENIRILQKQHYHDPSNATRQDLEQAYAVLTIDVEYLLKRCHLIDEA